MPYADGFVKSMPFHGKRMFRGGFKTMVSLERGADMRNLKKALAVAALVMTSAAVMAQVGVLQGTVTGVKAGTVLPVFKGEAKVGEIKVGEGGKFSVPLATGVYTVTCPGGKVTKVAALNGAATISINCE